MKKLYTLIFFLSTTLVSSVNAQLNNHVSARLQSVLDSTCAKYIIKGASAAILVPGIGTWKGVYGVSHPGEAVKSEMLFGIGSNTKTYTSCIMLKLQEMGKLSLTDTIGKWIHNQKYISGKITIKQILNHTSGLFSFTDNPDFNDSMLADFSRIWTPEEALRFVLAPTFKPGASWAYSNTNYIIAGIIIKQVMNQPYEVTLRDFIFDPQGFQNSVLIPQETAKSPIAYQWSIGVNGTNQLPIFDLPGYSNNAFYSLAYSAGAIFQTAEDNVNFWHNLMTGKIIAMNSLSQFKKCVTIGSGPNGGAVGYGLGVFRYYNFLNKRPIYEHGGTALGYIAENAVDTISGICFSVLTNQDSVSNDILLTQVIGALHKVTLEMDMSGISPESYKSDNIKIYPNPASDLIQIETSITGGQSDLSLFDMTGKEVFSQEINNNKSEINIAQLPEGLYVARITDLKNQAKYSQKIQIKH